MTKTVYLLCISLLVIVVKCVSVSSDDVVLSPRTLLRGENILIPSKKMGGEQERKESNFDLNRKSRRNLLNFSDLIDVNIEFSKISVAQSKTVSPLFVFIKILKYDLFKYGFKSNCTQIIHAILNREIGIYLVLYFLLQVDKLVTKRRTQEGN